MRAGLLSFSLSKNFSAVKGEIWVAYCLFAQIFPLTLLRSSKSYADGADLQASGPVGWGGNTPLAQVFQMNATPLVHGLMTCTSGVLWALVGRLSLAGKNKKSLTISLCFDYEAFVTPSGFEPEAY